MSSTLLTRALAAGISSNPSASRKPIATQLRPGRDPDAGGPVVHPQFDGDSRDLTAAAIARRQLELHHARCRRAAKTAFAGGAAGIVFLCVFGLKPAGVAIPLFFAVASLLFAAASATLFARLAKLSLREGDEGSDDDDRGPGRGPDEPPEPHGGGDVQFDWAGFERDFRAYCDRAPALT